MDFDTIKSLKKIIIIKFNLKNLKKFKKDY